MSTETTSSTVNPAELKRRKLGRVLTKLGKVNRDQVHEALSKQQEEGRKRPLVSLVGLMADWVERLLDTNP